MRKVAVAACWQTDNLTYPSNVCWTVQQGLPPVRLEWLDDHMKVALETPFYYLEDDQSHIPHFPKVRPATWTGHLQSVAR
jgi:hypothetical protein